MTHGRCRFEHRLKTDAAKPFLLERLHHREPLGKHACVCGERVALLFALELEYREAREHRERPLMSLRRLA